MRAWMERERQMSEAGPRRLRAEELIDAGDKVLALVRVSARGKASGVPVEAHVWAVCRTSDGKLVEWTYFGATGRLPSKPLACRSKTLTPTPERSRRLLTLGPVWVPESQDLARGVGLEPTTYWLTASRSAG